nr:threonine/serine exporter family protein [Brevibacillus dissolubilis]
MTANNHVMETCILAGRIMLKSGAETYRVEDTMAHIAQAAGMDDVYSSVTPSTIILSYCDGDQDHTRMIRVFRGSVDLNKVTLVNQVSRHYVSGQLTLEQAHQHLLEIEQKKPQYPAWMQSLASGFASGSFTVLLGGTIWDMIPTMIAGMLVNKSIVYIEQVMRVKFFTEFLAGCVGGFFVLLMYHLFPDLHLNYMLIGTMLPLFPGMAVTNSLRDILAGDLVAGMSRGVEAVLTALSIAVATALVLSL